MNIFDIARRAGKNLKQAKLRTLFTSLAIAVGAFTIMMALAAGEGTRTYSNNLIQSNIDPQALMIVADESLVGPPSSGSASTGITEYNEETAMSASNGFSADTKPLTQEDIDTIAARDDIDVIQPILQLSSKYVTFPDNDKQYTIDYAVYNKNVLPDIASGSLPERGTDLAEGTIVVPAVYAETLGVSEQDLIGKTMTVVVTKPAEELSQEEMQKLLASGDMAKLQEAISGEDKAFDFTIVATSRPNQMSFGSAGDPQSSISAHDAEIINKYATEGTSSYGKFFGATGIVKEGIDPQTVKESLEGDGYTVQTTRDLQSFIFTIVNVLQWIVAGFGILALIASIFGIINTMYISVLERTNQIGLMRALGAPAKAIAKLFRYEAAWIGVLGGLIGIGLAYVAVIGLNPWINSSLELGDGNYLLAFSWWQAAILLVGLVVVAIAAGWWPARKAAKLDPIEALRTE